MFQTAPTSEHVNNNNGTKKRKTLSVNHFSQLDNLRVEMRNLLAALYTQPSMQHFCSLASSHTLTFSHSPSAFSLRPRTALEVEEHYVLQ